MTGTTPSTMDATAVVLAGGRSTRMGRDKAFLDLAGKPLIARVLDVLLPLFREVLVSGPRRPPYDGLGLPLVPDIVPGRGPLSGLHAGLVSNTVPRVSCRARPPFAAIIHRWDSYRFSRLLTRFTQNAIDSPSGDRAGEPGRMKRNRSPMRT